MYYSEILYKDVYEGISKMSKIIFDLEEFNKWLERLGCDCCMQGWLRVVNGNIMMKWESNINHVITKYDDIELKGEVEG